MKKIKKFVQYVVHLQRILKYILCVVSTKCVYNVLLKSPMIKNHYYSVFYVNSDIIQLFVKILYS